MSSSKLGVLGLFILVAQTLLAERPHIRIPRTERAPTLEDFMDGRSPETELTISDFRQQEPHEGQPVSASTLAYLSYDAQNLYVIFRCQANRKTLRARMSARDDLADDEETVTVGIDTFHDGRHAYMFIVNPLGIQMDGIATDGQDDDFSFDTVWRSQGRLTKQGYLVLIAVPFRSIRHARANAVSWGISLSRYIPQNDETSTFPEISDREEGYVAQFATLESPDRLAEGRHIELNPYTYLSSQRALDQGANTPAFGRRTQGRAGLDSKIVIGDSLTLDLTVHPDFSQVESDDPQVTLNQRYELYFPELRPFFLENSGFFQTPETLFYSRRIVDPEYGARLTGHIGGWTFGFLGADDRQGAVTGGNTGIGALRIERAIFNQSTIGMLATDVDGAGVSNRVYSLDTRLKLAPNWVLTAQAAYSYTNQPDTGERVAGAAPRSSGTANFLKVERTDRNWQFHTSYEDRSPGFHSDVGFIPRVDMRQSDTVFGYKWRPESGNILSFGPSLHAVATWDHEGRPQDWSLSVPLQLELKGPTTIEVSPGVGFERYQNIPFRKNDTSFSFFSNYFRHVGLIASWDQGGDINYYPAEGVLPFAARTMEGDTGIALRPSVKLSFENTYLYTRLASAGSVIFNNHVIRSKINYQFNSKLSLRAILDYNAVLSNQSLVDLDNTKRVTANVLFIYLVHPGTSVYMGYTNQLENLAYPYQNYGGFPGTSTSAQFFVKISYLIK